MTSPAFNRFTLPSTLNQEQRRIAATACILAAVADKPRNRFEIRRFVQDQLGFEWVTSDLIANVVYRLCGQKRLVPISPDGRAISLYKLPDDPMEPMARFSPEAERERDMKVIASLNWPKFFHVPSKEELRPYARTRSFDSERPIHL
jgi:hypothetical protein